MPYRYVASTKSGKVERGTSDLASRSAVVQDLESRGLMVVSVDEVGKGRAAVRFGSYFLGTIPHVQKVLFTKHLAVMLRAGLGIVDALHILTAQATSWRMRMVLASVLKRVERGDRFSDGLADFPAVFSPFYVNVVRAGELSGTLEENLEDLAVQFTKEHELRAKVRTTLMYPTVVLVAAVLIGFFFATYVLPRVAQLFYGLQGIKLPLVTRILLAVSGVARQHAVLLFFGLVGGGFFIYWFLRRKFLRPITHFIILRSPILGKIVKNVSLARFSLILHTLLHSGIDITRSLEITESVLGNVYYERALGKLIVGVQQGRSLSAGILRYDKLFPPIVGHMLEVGEKSGKLEDVLGYLADFYDLEVETAMRNLTTILEPVLLLFIGSVALAMAFAILIPIYDFIGAIGRI